MAEHVENGETDDMPTEELIRELCVKVVESLNLEDVDPAGIDPNEPLFDEGLGLDSIDALELVVMLEKDYGIALKDIEVTKKAFASIRAMATFVEENLNS